MKKLVTYILCLTCIALLFTSCTKLDPTPGTTTTAQFQNTEQAKSTNTTEASTAPTAPPVNNPYPQYVQTDINEIVKSYRYGKLSKTTPICIPKILPFSEDAIACQTEIESYFIPIVENIRENAAQNYGIQYAYIEHDVYLNENILSVVIHERSMFDSSIFTVYNFDIESGKRLNTEELMNKLQITDYAEKFTQIAQNAFEAKLVGCTPEFLEEHRDLYNMQKEKNISKENIDKAMPYVAEDGKVMVVIDIYGMAGASCYAEVFPLT